MQGLLAKTISFIRQRLESAEEGAVEVELIDITGAEEGRLTVRRRLQHQHHMQQAMRQRKQKHQLLLHHLH